MRRPKGNNSCYCKCYTYRTNCNELHCLLSKCYGLGFNGHGQQPALVHGCYGWHRQCNSTCSIYHSGGYYQLLCKPNDQWMRKSKGYDCRYRYGPAHGTNGNIFGYVLPKCNIHCFNGHGQQPALVHHCYGRYWHSYGSGTDNCHRWQHYLLCESGQ